MALRRLQLFGEEPFGGEAERLAHLLNRRLAQPQRIGLAQHRAEIRRVHAVEGDRRRLEEALDLRREVRRRRLLVVSEAELGGAVEREHEGGAVDSFDAGAQPAAHLGQLGVEGDGGGDGRRKLGHAPHVEGGGALESHRERLVVEHLHRQAELRRHLAHLRAHRHRRRRRRQLLHLGVEVSAREQRLVNPLARAV